MYRLGIDVGETNTDAVLLDSYSRIVQTVKKPTSPDIASGICAVLKEIIEHNQTDPKDIAAVMIGTTHCLQALRKRKIFPQFSYSASEAEKTQYLRFLKEMIL